MSSPTYTYTLLLRILLAWLDFLCDTLCWQTFTWMLDIAVSVFASVPFWQLDHCQSQPRPALPSLTFPHSPRPEQKKELIDSGIRCQDVQIALAPRW